MLGRRPLLLLAALAGLSVAAEARADLPPPPEISACKGKAIGAACKRDGEAGECVADSCSRREYAGGEAKIVAYTCGRCEVGAAAAKAAKAEPTAPEVIEAPEVVEAPVSEAPVIEAPPEPATPTPAVDAPPVVVEEAAPSAPPVSKGICSIGQVDERGALALVVALVAAVGRRRRTPA